MNAVYEKVLGCYESIKDQIPFTPKVALVLGSGLGNYADTMDVKAEIDYKDIKDFPVSTVPGHAGKFIFGYVDKVPVVCMKGRVHFYEGYPISDVVLPTRLMKMMGAEILFLTNASTDGTEEMILQDYNIDQVIYCNTGANLGGAGGFEYGVGKAAELGYEYIWIMETM